MLTEETPSAKGIIDAFTPDEMYELRKSTERFGKHNLKSHRLIAEAISSKGYNPRIEQYYNFYRAVLKADHPILAKYSALKTVDLD